MSIVVNIIGMFGSGWQSKCHTEKVFSMALGHSDVETTALQTQCINQHTLRYAVADARAIPRPIINDIISRCADNCINQAHQDECDLRCICIGNELIGSLSYTEWNELTRTLSQTEWNELTRARVQKQIPRTALAQKILAFAAVCKMR